MTNPELARQLHAEGLGYKRIAKKLGVSRDKARDWCLPSRRAGMPSTARGRRPFPCSRCGERMTRESGVCARCRHREVEARRRRIASMHREGIPLRKIAETVGATVVLVGQDVNRMRKQGVNIPYRYRRRP